MLHNKIITKKQELGQLERMIHDPGLRVREGVSRIKPGGCLEDTGHISGISAT